MVQSNPAKRDIPISLTVALSDSTIATQVDGDRVFQSITHLHSQKLQTRRLYCTYGLDKNIQQVGFSSALMLRICADVLQSYQDVVKTKESKESFSQDSDNQHLVVHLAEEYTQACENYNDAVLAFRSNFPDELLYFRWVFEKVE